MKIDLEMDLESFKLHKDDLWASGVRCTVCKKELDAYEQRDGHNIVDCLRGVVLRIEKLESNK